MAQTASRTRSRPGRPGRDRVGGDWLTILRVWLATRIMFAAIAVGVAISTGKTLDKVIAQWDVAHFLTIAADGYADPEEMAFFPGLPLVLRALTNLGISPVYGGTLIALVLSLVAAEALRRLIGVRGTIAWLLLPTAVFTAVAYTESFFCAAAFWAWERATRNRWGQAALLAALATTMRVSGLFLIGSLVILAITQDLRRGEDLARRLSFLLIPTAVLVIYAVYLYTLTDSWTAWFSAQAAGWNREFHWPWEALQNHWQVLWIPTPDHPEWVWIYRAELIAWLIGLVGAGVLLLRRRIAESAWVGVQVLAFSLSYWLQSVPRALLLWFPVWGLVGDYVDARPRTRGWLVVGWTVVGLAVALQGVWAWLYFSGRWAS